MKTEPSVLNNVTTVVDIFSYEIEKFARNTGLKLFRTSVKENLNVSKVFHYLAERHIEAVSRWSDEAADEAVTFAIGAHQQHHRDTRYHLSHICFPVCCVHSIHMWFSVQGLISLQGPLLK